MLNEMASNPLSEMGEAALYYVRQGLKVFPCSPNSKAPLIPKEAGGKGHHDATSDPAKIREWWTQWPDANIGLNLRESGLVCVDADIYKPECQWETLRAGRDIPQTWVQQSPRGGMHYIFRAVEGVEYGGNTFKGVDLKWNGYILLSPSKVDGKEYAAIENRYLAVAPDWLPRTQAVVAPAINPHKRHEDRSKVLFQFIKEQWERGFSVDEIQAMCEAAPEATGADRFNGNISNLRKDIERIVGKPSPIWGGATEAHGRWLWENCLYVGGVSKAALLGTTALYIFNNVTGTEETAVMEHYIDPWLPKGIVVGVYGRGESGKSSWVSTMVAQASNQVSTLWISSEEDLTNIAVRYTKSGGQPNTLKLLSGAPTLTGSDKIEVFDVYGRLERVVNDAQEQARADRPLGVVVLDAIGALVTWPKGDNANDDGSVKRLIAHLHTLSQRYGVTIVIIGHMNKNPKTEHVADAVNGSLSWTSSVRRAFLFYKDKGSDSDYDFYVRTAKANTGTHFASSYRTVPVHTIHQRVDGPGEVLCKVEFTSPPVWGEAEISRLINDSPEDDPNHTVKAKRKEKENAKIACVVQAIKAGCETRADIIAYCDHPDRGIKINAYDFPRKLDAALQAGHGVQIINAGHNKYIYRCA